MRANPSPISYKDKLLGNRFGLPYLLVSCSKKDVLNGFGIVFFAPLAFQGSPGFFPRGLREHLHARGYDHCLLLKVSIKPETSLAFFANLVRGRCNNELE